MSRGDGCSGGVRAMTVACPRDRGGRCTKHASVSAASWWERGDATRDPACCANSALPERPAGRPTPPQLPTLLSGLSTRPPQHQEMLLRMAAQVR